MQQVKVAIAAEVTVTLAGLVCATAQGAERQHRANQADATSFAASFNDMTLLR
jgi:hypothetical protein